MQKKIKEKIKFLKFCILDENLEIHREIYLYLYIYIYHKRMAGCISLEEWKKREKWSKLENLRPKYNLKLGKDSPEVQSNVHDDVLIWEKN